MGALLSRWRKKETTEQVLEDLQEKIDLLEESKKTSIEKQRRMIGSLVLYSVLLYIVSALVFCTRYLPETWPQRILYSSPLAVFPVLVWLVRKFMRYYFVKRISKNETALDELKEKKKTILEEVMEKETYKRAREILEKYDPDRFKNLEGPMTSTPLQKTPSVQDLRQRGGMQPPGSVPPTPAGTPFPTPGPVRKEFQGGNPMPKSPQFSRHQMATPGALPRNGTEMVTPRPPPMPRPVLPRDRTVVDRFVEYLLGDGPQNRYALICSQCTSHNGMALREEFEYIQFRCCYCFAVNPARKKRPNAPKLEEMTPAPRRANLGVRLPKHVTDSESDDPKDTEDQCQGQTKGEGQSQARSRKTASTEKIPETTDEENLPESQDNKKDA